MVTGDLHGHRRNFNLIRRIAASDNIPERHLVLQEVCHGGPTYPQNGGCMSHTHAGGRRQAEGRVSRTGSISSWATTNWPR